MIGKSEKEMFIEISKEKEKIEKKVNRCGMTSGFCLITGILIFLVCLIVDIFLDIPKENIVVVLVLSILLLAAGNCAEYYREGVWDGTMLHILSQIETLNERSNGNKKCQDKD